MLKVLENLDLNELKKYGFHSFKVNRLQTNYYRLFSHGATMIIVNNLCRELVIDKWRDNDTRIHKVPKTSYKDMTTIEDCIFDLAVGGVIEKASYENSEIHKTLSSGAFNFFGDVFKGPTGYVGIIKSNNDEE